ncbi:somatostatin receptor type 4-like [Glandiceps talaboti]
MDQIEQSYRPGNFALFLNDSFDYNDEDDSIYARRQELPQWVFLHLTPMINCLVCITGLVGNGVVIYVLMRYATPKTVPNIYILNLAAADFLILLGLPFVTYNQRTRRWIFGDAMCKIVMGLDGMNMFTGIFTLTAMGVDRYLAIVHAVWSKSHRTLNSARAICVFLWILSIASTMPLWLYAETQTFGNDTVCNIGVMPPAVQQTFLFYSFALGFAFPIIIILMCYTSILVFLARCAKRTDSRKRSRLGKVGILVLLAVALFIVCWLPFWVGQLLVLFGDSSFSVQVVYYFSFSLQYANCCLNPLIYTYVRQDFRKYLNIFYFSKLNKVRYCRMNTLFERSRQVCYMSAL